jgi:hypothetical protein
MSILGFGTATAITDTDMALLADELDCHPANLEAIAMVESQGFGWFKDGRMKILDEKHWFYKLVDPSQRKRAVTLGLARKKWVSPKNGGYKDQATADQRYNILAKQIEIDPSAAFSSISMGKFQIMGFNHKICGYISPGSMFHSFLESEVNQLAAFANFLKGKGLVNALRNGDFETVEFVYNGGGLGGTYARRMREAARDLRDGKWSDYTRGSRLPRDDEPKKETSVHRPVKKIPAPPASGSILSTLIEYIVTLILGRRW